MKFISGLGYVLKEGLMQVIRAKGLSVAVVVIVGVVVVIKNKR